MDKAFRGIIIILLVIALIYFFYPKDAGKTCITCPKPPAVQKTESLCLGITQEKAPSPNCIYCESKTICYGMVSAKKTCYTNITGDEIKLASC